MENFFAQNAWLLPALPLLGFILNGLPTALGMRLPRAFVHAVACGVMFLAFILAAGIFLHLHHLPAEARSFTNTVWPWISIGTLHVNVAFLLDPLSTVMALIITGVGFLIHVYSVGYMHEDPDYARFFSYLNLFCFMMLLLVLGDNLLLLFVGWEGVGLCSYLLIGFWYKDRANGVAGMKAFIVNRIGDFGLMVGLLLLFWSLNSVGQATLNFTELKSALSSIEGLTVLGGVSVITVIGILLFIGATGKSAQIPLYVWLPDAMAGPTPVSALIHAATMVTAGVYMVARLNPLYALSPDALMVIATVGAFTALLGASIGFAQNDIKKVLAYSTVSQLGYMFLALGSGAYAAAVFHLMTHAFFKACLFLGSGSVIMGMHHEQDMRAMGGLKKYMPITFWTFMAATMAISGIVPFSGFFSKDEILWQTFSHGHAQTWYYFLWALGLTAAMGTAFYMMRCVALTFLGEFRGGAHGHGVKPHTPHESPWTVTVPLIILAILATLGGFLNVPFILGQIFGSNSSGFFNEWLAPVIPLSEHHEVHAAEWVFMITSVLVAAFFMFVGTQLYTRRHDIVATFTKRFAGIYDMVARKYYIDEIYHEIFVKGLLWLNRQAARFDNKVIDGLVNLTGKATSIYSAIIGWCDSFFVDGVVNGVARVTDVCGQKLKKVQSGNIQHYAFAAVLGVVVVLMIKVLKF